LRLRLDYIAEVPSDRFVLGIGCGLCIQNESGALEVPHFVWRGCSKASGCRLVVTLVCFISLCDALPLNLEDITSMEFMIQLWHRPEHLTVLARQHSHLLTGLTREHIAFLGPVFMKLFVDHLAVVGGGSRDLGVRVPREQLLFIYQPADCVLAKERPRSHLMFVKLFNAVSRSVRVIPGSRLLRL